MKRDEQETKNQPQVRKRVSIRFCGGCNPRIDRGLIAGQLRDEFTEQGHDVVFNQSDADVIIYLSGCASECAYRYNQDSVNTAFVRIGGTVIDGVTVADGKLIPCVLNKTRSYLQVNNL